MRCLRIDGARFPELWTLHQAYKAAISENAPTDRDRDSPREAMARGDILFYGCLDDEGELISCCSVSPTFSTFRYGRAGVFEDFYIAPAWRHRGVARRLVAFAMADSGVTSLTVGCADCDVAMYKALGFTVPLGNMLAYDL